MITLFVLYKAKILRSKKFFGKSLYTTNMYIYIYIYICTSIELQWTFIAFFDVYLTMKWLAH